MRIMDYDQALVLFDLSKLKTKGLVDLTVDANGNIAITVSFRQGCVTGDGGDR